MFAELTHIGLCSSPKDLTFQLQYGIREPGYVYEIEGDPCPIFVVFPSVPQNAVRIKIDDLQPEDTPALAPENYGRLRPTSACTDEFLQAYRFSFS